MGCYGKTKLNIHIFLYYIFTVCEKISLKIIWFFSELSVLSVIYTYYVVFYNNLLQHYISIRICPNYFCMKISTPFNLYI
jgi:hypothetical protein